MEKINFRKCLITDCEYIYNLDNDKVSRDNSFNTEFIPYDIHLKWFQNSLENKNRDIYVIQYEGNDIGQIRLDTVNDITIEISYVVEKSYRGKGLGTKVISSIEKFIKENKSKISFITAKVKKENYSSRKILLKNQYTEIDECDFLKYKKIIK